MVASLASSHYIGMVPERLAATYAEPLSLRRFPIPADLPPIDVRMLWHARLDADPAQHWLRETILNCW